MRQKSGFMIVFGSEFGSGFRRRLSGFGSGFGSIFRSAFGSGFGSGFGRRIYYGSEDPPEERGISGGVPLRNQRKRPNLSVGPPEGKGVFRGFPPKNLKKRPNFSVGLSGSIFGRLLGIYKLFTTGKSYAPAHIIVESYEFLTLYLTVLCISRPSSKVDHENVAF